MVALATTFFGVFLVYVASPERLLDWGFSKTFIDWAERLPTDPPAEHALFYGSLFALALTMSVATFLVSGGSSGLTPANVLLAPLLGWLMVWAVLGFHLINPFARAFPSFINFGSLFFHFVAVVNVFVAPLAWITIGYQRSEIPGAMAVMIGAAVGSSQFYRYWQARSAVRAAESDRDAEALVD